MGQIKDLSIEIHQIAKDHGWWDEDLLTNKAKADPWVNAGKLMLMVSELSEALEDIRNQTWENLPIELADAVIRIFDYCEWQGIDLEEAMEYKIAYNKTRPYKHGGKAI